MVVRFQVDFKVAFLCEIFVTKVALEGLYPQVFTEVNLETRLLRIRNWAKMALVRFDEPVVHQMGLEVSFCNEGIGAARMHAFIGSVVSLRTNQPKITYVRSHVGLQIARVAELFLTLNKWAQHRHFLARLTG